MDALLARRRLLRTKLTRLRTKLDATPNDEWDIHAARVIEEQIREHWVEFTELFEEILSTCPVDTEEDHQNQYLETAERFDEAKVAIRRILEGLSEPNQQESNRQHRREQGQADMPIKLPKFDIPTFSGNILEWTSFCDLFTSTVDEHPNLKGSVKLKFLKNAVRGEAAELLNDFQISDANYIEAWETLKKRYKNDRELVRSHLVRFLGLPSLKTESGGDLRKLVDTASSVIRALKALKRPIPDDCDLAIHVVTTRLDTETTKLWETKLGRYKFPKLSELLEFLEERAAILCASESGKEKTAPSQQKPNATATTKKASVHQTSSDGACAVCNKESHPIYNCKEFLDLPIAERRG